MLRYVCGRQLLTARRKLVDNIAGFGVAMFTLIVGYVRLMLLHIFQDTARCTIVDDEVG